MAQNDNAVLTAAVGYVYVAPVGTARPTPAALAALDPTIFGAQTQTVKVTGSPTGGTFTLTVGAQTTSAIAYNADSSAVAVALEALSSVGAGNVSVTGSSISTGSGLTVAWVGSLLGTTATVTATASLTGGTSPGVTVTAGDAPNGWKSVGHTSRGDLPEFGFDGGKTEVRGTWQNESLREIQTEPVADYLSMFLHQFDTNSFELYYGEDASSVSGVFGVASGNVPPVERALLVIIMDGSEKLGFYSPKASIRRDDSIELQEDDFAALPVKATFLKYGSNNKFEWVSEELFA